MSPEFVTMPSCERRIRQTGWGLYHHFMIGLASASAFAQASALTSVPFAAPLAVCDISLSETTMTLIHVCFSFGMAIGGFIFTSISDILGRKCIIPFSLLLIFGSTFACGFAHGSTMFLICIFTLGSGLATNESCVKIHLAEILPAERRGWCLTFPDLFWGLGYIISALVAWLLTPSIIHHQSMEMRLATWRLMFGLSGACSIIVACASALMLPSPRYLLYSKKYPEALDTLKHIYAINSSRHSDTFSLRQEDLEGCVDDFSMNNQPRAVNCTEHTVVALRRLFALSSQLIKRRFLRVTVLVVCVKFAVLFGMLTINIWLAKMLHLSDEINCNFTAIDILQLEGNLNNCKFSLSTALYRDFFLIALNIIIGQLVLLIIVDRIGRRFAIIGGCIACGVCSFALGYIHNIYPLQLAASSVFMMAYSLVESALTIVIIEVYPTAFRGTASGATQFFARFAGGFVKRFLQTPCQYSFIFIGALMLAAAVLSYFLPDLRGQAMVE